MSRVFKKEGEGSQVEDRPPLNGASVLHWTENQLWSCPEYLIAFDCVLSPLRTSVLSLVKYGYNNGNTP